MASLLLVDSNFYITQGVTGRDPLAELARHADDWDIATCGVIVAEVLRGRSLPKVKERFSVAFAHMLQIPTTPEVWRDAAEMAWELDRRGKVLPLTDIVIAACARASGAVVLTQDKHFAQIPGLRVMDGLDTLFWRPL